MNNSFGITLFITQYEYMNKQRKEVILFFSKIFSMINDSLALIRDENFLVFTGIPVFPEPKITFLEMGNGSNFF